MIRLQKVLADRGDASRRRAEELIAAGRVRVDGEIVNTLGTKVPADARIDVDDAATRTATPRYVALNKPAGIVSTARDERGRRTVVDLVGGPERLYPVGRLDAESEGLMLLTNDGEWAERVIHPRYGHEREYEVIVSGELTPVAIAQLRRGIRVEEGLARAERVDVRSRSRSGSRMHLVLRSGYKRQIRRMCAAVGLRVERLVRVRIGTLSLGRLGVGAWRELTPAEIAALARPTKVLARSAPKPSQLAAPRRYDATGSPRSTLAALAEQGPLPLGPKAPRAPRAPRRAVRMRRRSREFAR
jgi:23S rRNA pseudouridine2605 synthase